MDGESSSVFDDRREDGRSGYDEALDSTDPGVTGSNERKTLEGFEGVTGRSFGSAGADPNE